MAGEELGKTGRVLLRTSGTEAAVRIMVEAPSQEKAEEVCAHLCSVVESELAVMSAIGIGIDTVEVQRFRESLERTPQLMDRLFTEGEHAYGLNHQDSGPSLAVRFAAKEATMKALGVGLGAFDFHDVEVVKADSGAPLLNVTGCGRVGSQQGVTSWKVSLSHTCSIATAVVFAE